MATALLGLGSNLGDREQTLFTAIDEIGALPNVRVSKRSGLHRAMPIGGPPGQGEFLNAAIVVETAIPPLPFLDLLQRIEHRHGRERLERWAARSLDIDLLVYGDEVIETASLIVPHLRMSFRRFVLEPAAEVAARMVHPVIGWPIERLLLHLNDARDELVVLSPSEELRGQIAESISQNFGAAVIERPTFKTADTLWPPSYSLWLSVPSQERPTSKPSAPIPYAAAAFPKLTVLVDASHADAGRPKAEWTQTVRQPGRGPILRLQLLDAAAIRDEVFAAVESVWPDLGPASGNRLE